MHDENFARRLTARLDEAPVPYSAQVKLAAARRIALSRQAAVAHTGRNALALRLKTGGLVLLMVFMMGAAYTYWQAEQYLAQLIDTDTEILAGDSDIEFYRDPDVSAYLRDLSMQGTVTTLDP